MKYQQRVWLWMFECFGGQVARDRVERNHRFLEESLELVQANGCTKSEALQLVEYVYGRPVGEPQQELGGVMVTLAALSEAHDLDMEGAGALELSRISDASIMAKIRAKQAAKPKCSPLPEQLHTEPETARTTFGGALRSIEDWRNGENMAVQNLQSRVEYDKPVQQLRGLDAANALVDDPHEFRDAFEKIDQ